MSTKKPVYLFFLTFVLLCQPLLGWATTYAKMDFKTMVQTAATCVVGKAVESKSLRVNGAVETHTTFEVNNVAFGTTDKHITVVTAGGRIQTGKIPMVEVTAGAPRFFAGKESMLLLNGASAANTYSIVGFNQGLFSVLETENGSQVQLPESLGGSTQVKDAIKMIQATRLNQPAKKEGALQ